MKKYEGLLDEKLDIDEKLRVSTNADEIIKEKLRKQEELIVDLK
jgi:hypothetical protein